MQVFASLVLPCPGAMRDHLPMHAIAPELRVETPAQNRIAAWNAGGTKRAAKIQDEGFFGGRVS